MKHTMIKDAFRNIRKNLVSWLSIVVIACLAVTAYIGILFSADSLRHNASIFYTDTNFRDEEILGTMLLSEDDIAAISASEGVQAVDAVRKADLLLSCNGKDDDVTVISLSDRINSPVIKSGSYPVSPDECLIETDLAEAFGLDVGDTVELPDSEYLSRNKFTVSGLAVHPDHIVITDGVKGNRYIMVAMSNFDADAFDNCYNAAEVVFDKKAGANRFSKSYFSSVSPYVEKLEALAAEREGLRHDDIRGRYQDKIDEGEKKLEESEDKLAEARAELDKNEGLIAEGEAELAAAKKKLADGKAELASAKKQLDKGKKQLAAGKKKLNKAKKKLNKAKKQLSESYSDLLDCRTVLQEALTAAIKLKYPDKADEFEWITKKTFNINSKKLSVKKFPIAKDWSADLTKPFYDQLSTYLESHDIDPDEIMTEEMLEDVGKDYLDYLDQWDELTDDEKANIGDTAEQALVDAAKKWESGHKKYLKGLKEYNSGLATYNSKYAEYQQGLEDYKQGKKEYQQGLKDYNAGLAKLADARAQLAAGEEEYQEGLDKLDDGRSKLAEVRKQMNALEDSRWILMSVKGNASYVYTKAVSGNFISISSTFSLLFVFVGALVIYATVGKIIDEQRKLVGTTKALGFYNKEILAKYLSFGLSATFLGSIIAVAASYFVVEKALLGIQKYFFHFEADRPFFEIVPPAIAIVLGLLLSFTAVYLACTNMVKTPAVRLMQDTAPPTAKKAAKKASSGGSLYNKLILRNMISDPKRVVVTIVAIAGSCALMLIGMTISHSIESGVDLQFQKVYRYDYLIDYDKALNRKVSSEIEKVLSENGAEYIRVASVEKPFLDGDEISSTSILCGDIKELSDYNLFTDISGKHELTLSEEGVYVPQKLDETGGYTEAGTITIYGKVMEPYEVKVSGAVMMYTARFLVMSDKSYVETFGGNVPYNQYLIRMDAATADKIRAEIEGIRGVKSFYNSEARRVTFDNFVGIARGAVVILTIMAFIMAYFILLNLINMFVNQKKRELTVMRINGFTVGQTKAYIGREMVFTTALGIILGLIMGSAIGYKIILLLENINCFDRNIYFTGWLIAAGATVLITAFISMLALRKVKDLKLTDIA